MFSHLELSVFEERLGRKLRFALHFPFKMPPLKRLQNRTFLASAPRSDFGAGLGQEKLLSCQRNSTGLCTLLLANCIGVAASWLLYVFAAHVVPWSFANLLLANRIGMVASKLRR